jgi:hypothetical protein
MNEGKLGSRSAIFDTGREDWFEPMRKLKKQ